MARDLSGTSVSRIDSYLCGSALAHGHARTGDRIALAAYLGDSERFEAALSRYAVVYADQTERDHSLLRRAINAGRVAAITGV